MDLAKYVSRLRILLLALPLFALASTIQAGCSASSSGNYYYGDPYGDGGSYGGPYGSPYGGPYGGD